MVFNWAAIWGFSGLIFFGIIYLILSVSEENTKNIKFALLISLMLAMFGTLSVTVIIQ